MWTTLEFFFDWGTPASVAGRISVGTMSLRNQAQALLSLRDQAHSKLSLRDQAQATVESNTE